MMDATGRGALFPGKSADVLGVPVVACTTSEFIQTVIPAARRADRDNPLFITYLNAWCSEVASRDAEYADILRHSDAVYADGQVIVWAAKYLGGTLPERVNAADFILDFCRAAVDARARLYLLGSAPGVAAEAAETFRKAAPGLDIAAAEPGYLREDDEAVVARIRAAAPDLLIVGRGVPLQEKWAWALRSKFGCGAVWCVGAMFEYHAGARARAPRWVRRCGLEWLFRLVLEPRRLWRRYLVGNARFLWRLARARFGC
jgi:N-acetylglucosaminyldiphosphoundecaprenol N-acetyl-beta-D-mannosaminyltransferase